MAFFLLPSPSQCSCTRVTKLPVGRPVPGVALAGWQPLCQVLEPAGSTELPWSPHNHGYHVYPSQAAPLSTPVSTHLDFQPVLHLLVLSGPGSLCVVSGQPLVLPAGTRPLGRETCRTSASFATPTAEPRPPPTAHLREEELFPLWETGFWARTR